MRLFLAIILFPICALATTDFYITPTGNNLNGGSTTNDNAHYVGTGGFWTNATGVWRKDGETFTDVVVGDWASVYPDGIAATDSTSFVGLVTNVTETNIWMSLVAKIGVSPADDVAGPGATSIRVGGAWRGPNTNQNPSITFPFNWIAGTMTNTPSDPPVINITGSYYVTNGIYETNAGPLLVRGYDATPGDGGFATIDGGTEYPTYQLFTINGANLQIENMVFSNNGVAGNRDGVLVSGNAIRFRRCVFHDFGRNGILNNAGNLAVYECEAYSCNKGNNTGAGGISGVNYLERCVSRENSTSASSGFVTGAGTIAIFDSCIAYRNGRSGILVGITAVGNFVVNGSCLYSNNHAGIELNSAGPLNIENSIFAKNGAGITNTVATILKNGNIDNCIFGSGTAENTHGATTNFYGVTVSGSMTYAANQLPWVDAYNGDFTLTSSSSAKAAGRGSFPQSATNTVSFPDVGAVQSPSTNSAAAGSAYTFAQ